MKHMRATTKAHYEHYCKEVRRWCRVLGVTGWQIYFEHCDCEDKFARVAYCYRDGAATFMFPLERDTLHHPLNKKTISWAARHEALHLLLSPLWTIGAERFTTREELDTVEEQIVAKLEAALSRLGRG